MAVKDFTPFIKGSQIAVSEWNTTFQTDGLEGTLTSISGDQVAKEGLTADVINKGRQGTIGSATTAGSGSPYYFGHVSAHLDVDLIMQGLGTALAGTLSGSGTAGTLKVDWTPSLDLLEIGDVVVVEFIGTLDTVHYLTMPWASAPVHPVPPPTTPAGAAAGAYPWNPTWAAFYSSLSFRQDTGTGFEPPNSLHHIVHTFSPWMGMESVNSPGDFRIMWTTADDVFDGATDNGPGQAIDFHMTMIYPILGWETKLEFAVAMTPQAGPGDTGPAVAPPAMKIYAGAHLHSYVLRGAI